MTICIETTFVQGPLNKDLIHLLILFFFKEGIQSLYNI